MSWEFDASGFSDEDVRNAFRIWGFVVIRNALAAEEVKAVRAALDRAWAEPHMRDLPTMCSTELLKHPEVWQNLFKESIVKPLRAALGPELCYQNDMDVQRNSYGLTGLRASSGWHMDAGSEAKESYLRAPEYRFAKCGIYLQDADNGWGGGIRVKPKSHRSLFEANPLKRRLFRMQRVATVGASKLRLDFGTFEVPTRAGDLCFFDSRLLHSSMAPSPESVRSVGYDRVENVPRFWPGVPKEHTKYVIYWDSCNAAMSEDFLRNSVRRSEGEPPGMTEKPSQPAVFTRLLSMRFPDSFPAAFVAAANARNVQVASLDAGRANGFKEKLKSMRLLHP